MPNQFGDIPDRGISTALQRRLGVDPSLTLSLMPELAAMMALPSDELLYHMGWRRYSLRLSLAAVAANAGIIRMRMPPGTNLIAIVERVLTWSGAAIEVGSSMTSGAGNLTTVVAGGLPRDTRQNDGTNLAIGSTLVCSTDSIGLQVGTSSDMPALANVAVDLPQLPTILTPGFALNCFTQQLNQAVNWTVVWRERILNDQENAP
jgi:hypothetical protein